MALNLNGLTKGTTPAQIKEAMTPSSFLKKKEDINGIIIDIETNAKYLSPILINSNVIDNAKRSDEVYISYKLE
jgi:hypothetical protein